ncbi:MAG: Vps62-related protein [Anaerolineales bacterium]
MNPPADRPVMPVSTPELELLQRFEPVLRYTKGEQFFPTDVERYVRACSLWAHYPSGRDELLVQQDFLTMQKLVEPRPAAFGTMHYLRFIEPLSLSESAATIAEQLQLRAVLKNTFHPGVGRLARGGLLPRVADALFSISFLLRGRVPAAVAAAAEIDYYNMRTKQETFFYYGRVVRDGDWTVLQYWYFYCFNSWRSGFGGVNDHESDWEMVSIYLYEDNGQLIPEWLAYASHDFVGDDLRRRWDDASEMDFVDGHPVVYSGAGSHASYFRPGEYQAEANLNLPQWVQVLRGLWNKVWTETLGQEPADPFRIPFVDYARGDGMAIGAGQPYNWHGVMIDESIPWVSQYRGLWGFFARDPISGENAPAGPMYNRDGTPRGAWYDPLGFAGLDKVPTPPDALRLLEKNGAELSARQTELVTLVPDHTNRLQELGARLKSLEHQPHLAREYGALQKQILSFTEELHAMRREHTENEAVLESINGRLQTLRQGVPDDPHGHILHLAMPVRSTHMRFARVAQAWAAISLSALLFAIVTLLLLAPRFLPAGLVIITLLFIVTESFLRGAFIHTVGEVTVLLAVIASVILFLHFWFWILIAALLAVASFLLFQRLRELTG